MKTFVTLVGLLASLSLAASSEMNRRVIYEAGTNGYFTYRIASMVATKEGTLLAFAAARKGKGGDWDPINIVMRRSTDMGKTWNPMQVVVEDGDLPCDNAMPITDYITGRCISFTRSITPSVFTPSLLMMVSAGKRPLR